MFHFISIVIPNYNAATTITKCLEAVFASAYENFEVIVVDDCSADSSVELIRSFPCRLIALPEHAGAAKTRNIGALHARGEVVFFIDADCLVTPETLSRVNDAYQRNGPDVIIGGTYTKEPGDNSFFSRFQSVFIHYSELKKLTHPDYIATHAMIISAAVFKASEGFWQEDDLPILEDVEFSHRLRRMGYQLVMDSDILVTHIFNYDLHKSIRNAVRKAKYWTAYSMRNKDVFADSGTASLELKVNVFCWCLCACLLLSAFLLSKASLAWLVVLVGCVNVLVNRKLVREMFKGMGLGFALRAVSYYLWIYPLAVGIGVSAGLLHYLAMDKKA